MVLRDLLEGEGRPVRVLLFQFPAHQLEPLQHRRLIPGRPVLDLEDQEERWFTERILVTRRDAIAEPEQVSTPHVPTRSARAKHPLTAHGEDQAFALVGVIVHVRARWYLDVVRPAALGVQQRSETALERVDAWCVDRVAQ